MANKNSGLAGIPLILESSYQPTLDVIGRTDTKHGDSQKKRVIINSKQKMEFLLMKKTEVLIKWLNELNSPDKAQPHYLKLLRIKLIVLMLIIALCVAVHGFNGQCLVTILSWVTAQNTLILNPENDLSYSINNPHSMTTKLHYHAVDALDAGLTTPGIGQSGVCMRHRCMTKTHSSPLLITMNHSPLTGQSIRRLYEISLKDYVNI